MAVINNLQQFHAAIAAVCPIDGVDADGNIFYSESATLSQKDAAKDAAYGYTDVVPSPLTIDVAMARMTDDEYQKLIKHADKNVKMHRVITHERLFDLALQSTQDAIDALVADHVLTEQRAQEVFAPLPLPPPPDVQIPPSPPSEPGISPVSGS